MGSDPLGHGHEQAAPAGVLAGFGSRLAASLLDSVFASLIMLVLAVPLVVGVSTRWETESEPCTVNGQAAMCDVPTDATFKLLLGALALWVVAAFVIGILYYVRPVAKTGQTPARKMLGIKVVNSQTGQPPSFGYALLRYFFANAISSTLCSLGYLWMLWDDRNQTWHDKVCSTVVVRA